MNRTELFLRAAEKLRAEFEESRVVPHPGVKGSDAEVLVRKFLNERLPKRFQAGSGFIVDQNDGVSRQTDIVVYDALNCPVYRVSDEGSVFPSDNVAAVIEVKSILDKAQLEDAWNKIASVKQLQKTPETNPNVFSHTLGLVFAFRSALQPRAILHDFAELVRTHKNIGYHMDGILILDEAYISLVAPGNSIVGWQPSFFEPGFRAAEGVHVSAAATKAGRHSLDLFFRILLYYLSLFRHRIDHPGFKMPEANEQALEYLFSVTGELDPERREAVLKQYADDVARDFKERRRNWEMKQPPNGQHES